MDDTSALALAVLRLCDAIEDGAPTRWHAWTQPTGHASTRTRYWTAIARQGSECDVPARTRSGANAIAGWRAFARKPSGAKWRADYSETYSGGCRGRNEPMKPTQIEVTQTIAKAAAKTFLQAFLSVLALLLVPVLTNWAVDLQNGGDIVVDVDFFRKVLIAAVGAGIAALISLSWNWARS